MWAKSVALSIQLLRILVKVAFRVQIWRETFCQNSDKFGYSFIKNDIMFIYIYFVFTKISLF